MPANNNKQKWILGGLIAAFILWPRKQETGGNGLPLPGLPRALGNNNPLALLMSDANWLGKIPNELNTDAYNPKLEQFETPVYGYRAALLNLNKYFILF